MATHLMVLGNHEAGNAGLFNPNRYSFRWNPDFTAFEPILLRYWDDASYIADQSRDHGAEVEQPIPSPDFHERSWKAFQAFMHDPIDEVQEPEFFPRDNVEKMPTENMWF